MFIHYHLAKTRFYFSAIRSLQIFGALFEPVAQIIVIAHFRSL